MHALRRAAACASSPRPAALDEATGTTTGRPDDVRAARAAASRRTRRFAIGATAVDVDDEHAIVESEVGFVAVMFPADEFADASLPHIEWPLPPERPAFAQGAIAGVPAKL